MSNMSLTSAEIEKIEGGLLRLETIGEDIVVPFSALKLSGANIVWLNERWFLNRQIDVFDDAVRSRVHKWLIDNFAYIVPSTATMPPANAVSKTFLADSYGGTGVMTHGGSGRVGIDGCFQVKGIGKTPLVGVESDWLHSHGCLWLEEALREAVYAELTACEFPHGAVPVLAVIDTGIDFHKPDGKHSARRALSIRPVVVRPAYLERAIAFLPPGAEHNARYRDVRRVKKVVSYFENLAQQAPDGKLSKVLEVTLAKLAAQIAFGRAHRLFPGNYSSSNFCINGALLDFGAYTAVANWCRTIGMNGLHGFGDEIAEVKQIIRSISFYVNKYKSSAVSALDPEEMVEKFVSTLDQEFEREFLYLFHLESVRDHSIKEKVLAALFSYYKKQQRFEVRFQNSVLKKLSWLGEVNAAEQSISNLNNAEHEVWGRLESAVASSTLEKKEKIVLGKRMRITAARLLTPRPETRRRALTKCLNEIIHAHVSGLLPTGMQDAVDDIISRNRRHWPAVPRHLIVLAQHSACRGTILYCENPETDERFLWLETVALPDYVWFGDRWLGRSKLERYQHSSNGGMWFGLFPVSDTAPIAILEVESLRLPDGAVWFEESRNAFN